MQFSVKNYTEADTILVSSSNHKSEGPMVTLQQYAGSLSFVHAMRADQARFMAAVLQIAADQADGIVDEVTA